MNTTEDDPPWERPGEFRRDGEPHRGPLLRALAVGSAFLTYAAFCCPPVGAASALLGVGVLILVRRDDALMRQGRMDPAGQLDLARARHQAYFGIVMGLAMLLIVGSVQLYFGAWHVYRILCEAIIGVFRR
jgi:hypothetical protein